MICRDICCDLRIREPGAPRTVGISGLDSDLVPCVMYDYFHARVYVHSAITLTATLALRVILNQQIFDDFW